MDNPQYTMEATNTVCQEDTANQEASDSQECQEDTTNQECQEGSDSQVLPEATDSQECQEALDSQEWVLEASPNQVLPVDSTNHTQDNQDSHSQANQGSHSQASMEDTATTGEVVENTVIAAHLVGAGAEVEEGKERSTVMVAEKVGTNQLILNNLSLGIVRYPRGLLKKSQ